MGSTNLSLVIHLILLLSWIAVLTTGENICVDSSKTKLLFTPGPVTTAESVKEAMVQDQGLTESSALNTMASIRKMLLAIDNLPADKYTAIPLQGSATFSLEAAIHLATPLDGKVLLLNNGYFVDSLEKICQKSRIKYDSVSWAEGKPVDINTVKSTLRDSKTKYAAVVMVHHETSYGIINPILKIGKLIKQYMPDAAFVVDAVSSFGCYPIPMEEAGIAFMVATSDKCLEGFPGMGFSVVEKSFIVKGKENHRTSVLDLPSEFEKLEKSSSSRFTWPVQVYSALEKALGLHLDEGRDNKLKRYQRNNDMLRSGMKKLKFQTFYQKNTTPSDLLTVYKWPTNPAFNFTLFSLRLETEGLIIYPASLTQLPIFRIANMGQLTTGDCERFLATVEKIIKEMGVDEPYA